MPCRRICCRPYAHKCKKVFPKDKTVSKVREECIRDDNFILISAKYMLDLYHSTRRCILANDFVRSVVASITLFVIGIQLTRDMNFVKLSPILRCNNSIIDALYITSL